LAKLNAQSAPYLEEAVGAFDPVICQADKNVILRHFSSETGLRSDELLEAIV
jgi:hypothetical protein